MKKKVIGAVAIFQDRTEAAKMAEELTGVKNFVDALRVQNHEHMNKLHTIAGLIQLGKSEKALQLAFKESSEQESVTDFLHQAIQNDAAAGLLLSKIKRGKELGISVKIDENSSFSAFPEHVDQHDIVVLLGNLIENAFGAFETADTEDKHIDISIEQNDEVLAILIEDNGSGISDQHIPHLYDKGFTVNKTGGTGYGLYLVKQIVDKGMGIIEVDTRQGQGTAFSILFPMKGRNHSMDIKVPLIEDDPMVQEVNKEFITGVSGFSVIATATDGDEGIRLIKDLRPGLVVLDVYMPKKTELKHSRKSENKSSKWTSSSSRPQKTKKQSSLCRKTVRPTIF